jgi:hypothetical protein
MAETIDGWVEWHGGDMPVTGDTVVEALTRGHHPLKYRFPLGPMDARMLGWGHGGWTNAFDITWYRVVPNDRKMLAMD